MKRAVMLALVTFIATGCFGESKSERAIAWIRQKPPPEFIPHPPAPPCRISQIRIGHFLQGATGGLLGGLKVWPRGPGRCSLLGTPRVRFSGGSAARVLWNAASGVTTAGGEGGPPREAVRSLGRGDEAIANIFWRNWCGKHTNESPAPPAALVVSLPRGGGSIRLGLQRGVIPRCDTPRQPSELSVGPFVAVAPEVGQGPLVPTILGGTRKGSSPEPWFDVKAGERFHYRVSLRNSSKRPFRFRRCPVYTEDYGSKARSTANWPAEKYVLNCKPVGRLGPGEQAIFAIEIEIPPQAEPGWASITWSFPEQAGDLQEAGLSVRR